MTKAHETMAITTEQFDATSFEIESTLHFLGVPAAETAEFMEIIEKYRPQVVTA